MEQARDSEASMCRIHMHEEETRAPLQVKCDWTKRRGPPMHEHFAWSWKRQVKCDCGDSLHPMRMHGIVSTVYTWTQQMLQSKHYETQLCGPCCTSPDTEGHIRIMVSQLYRNLSVVEGISICPEPELPFMPSKHKSSLESYHTRCQKYTLWHSMCLCHHNIERYLQRSQ